MEWKALLIGLALLAILWALVRAFNGLGVRRKEPEKDSADLWLHADTGPRPAAKPAKVDAPITPESPANDTDPD